MAFLTFRNGVHPYDAEKNCQKKSLYGEYFPEKWFIRCHSISELRRSLL